MQSRSRYPFLLFNSSTYNNPVSVNLSYILWFRALHEHIIAIYTWAFVSWCLLPKFAKGWCSCKKKKSLHTMLQLFCGKNCLLVLWVLKLKFIFVQQALGSKKLSCLQAIIICNYLVTFGFQCSPFVSIVAFCVDLIVANPVTD